MTKMTRMSGLLEALAMRFANQGGWRPSNKISNEAFVWILRKHPVYVKWSWIHGWHRPSCKVVYHLRPLTRGRCISSEQVHDTRQPNFLWIVWMMINAIHFWDLILFKFFLINTHWILTFCLPRKYSNISWISSGLAMAVVLYGHSSQVIRIDADADNWW